MKRLLCFLFGHDAKGQHIAYRGELYQYRCRRCRNLMTGWW